MKKNIKVTFRSKAAKQKYMKKQSLQPNSKEIVNQTDTSLTLTPDMKDYVSKKNHADLIYQVESVNEGILQDREKQLKNLKQGGTVSGGGYGPFKKTGRDTFVSLKGIKHNSNNLVKLIGGFSDFKVDESVNERYRPNVESKGWEVAQKIIRQLQSSVFRKLDDDELLEFRKAIADAFNLDGVLKENNIIEGKITKTFHFKGKTSTDIDEIDADFSRQGIKSKPDFNKMKVTVTGDERKIDKIAKFHRGIEEATINERRGGMDIIRRIVKNHQHEGGVDVQTANMILKVYDKVDNKTKKFLDHATLKQIVNLILKARR